MALITGASRGIGRALAVRLAREGVHVAAAARTDKPRANAKGTIHETAKACTSLGATALPVVMDVRDGAQVRAGIEATVAAFGRLDIAIHNAGALWWKPVADTPLRRFDLLHEVNARAGYALAHYALPHLRQAGEGHILFMSPPLVTEALPGKVAYGMSKLGLTLLAAGLAEEIRGDEIAVNALWPETAIESAATRHFHLGTPADWYKAELVADAACAALSRDAMAHTGEVLWAMEVLREAGTTDFTPYRCDPAHEPPPLTLGGVPRRGGAERGA